MERNLKKYIHLNTRTYTHITKPLCRALETNTILQINYTHTHTHRPLLLEWRRIHTNFYFLPANYCSELSDLLFPVSGKILLQ